MLKIRFSDQARKDLAEIWDYIATDNVAAADRTVDRLLLACGAFVENPDLGRRREEFRPGLRSLPIGKYVIFYRTDPEHVDVLRILHGAREIRVLLANDGPETFETEI